MIRLDAGLIDASARVPGASLAIEISVQVDHERRRQRGRQRRQPLVSEAPDRVRDLDTDLAEPLRQRVERMGDVRRVHVGAAAAFGLSARRIGPDHGDTTQIADAQRQCRRIAHQGPHNLVPQQHHAFGPCPAHEHPVLRQVARQLGPWPAIVEHTQPFHRRQHVARRAAYVGGRHLAVGDGIDEALAAVQRRARHLEITAGDHSLRRGVQAEPIAHHEAVETPLAAQHLVDHRDAVGGPRTVDAVVRGHDRHHACLLHRSLERNQVQLAAGCARRRASRCCCVRTRCRCR